MKIQWVIYLFLIACSAQAQDSVEPINCRKTLNTQTIPTVPEPAGSNPLSFSVGDAINNAINKVNTMITLRRQYCGHEPNSSGAKINCEEILQIDYEQLRNPQSKTDYLVSNSALFKNNSDLNAQKRICRDLEHKIANK